MKWKIFIATAALLLFIVCVLPINKVYTSVFSYGVICETVIVDPGHGGVDGGAVGITGTYEKNVNLEISKRTRDLLGFLGIQTVMTREEDMSIHRNGTSIREKKISDIKERCALVNNTENARLISVHLNHFSQESCHGAQVFYSNNDSSKKLATSVQNTLKFGIDKENMRVAQPAGKSIYLLSNVKCPAILVECGFLSNPREESLLKDEDYQKRLALSIVIGYINVREDL